MKNGIPKNPEKLVLFLDHLIAGDDKHQADHPLPKEDRTALEAARDKLSSLNGTVQTSRGQLRTSTHDRRECVETTVTLADRFRASVVRLYGSKGPELVDYALVTRRKPRKAGAAEAGNGSEAQKMERKLERAAARVLRKRAKLAAAQESLSKAEAILNQRKAEVEKSTPVAPTEPSPASEPTSESGTK